MLLFDKFRKLNRKTTCQDCLMHVMGVWEYYGNTPIPMGVFFSLISMKILSILGSQVFWKY